jgi:hypothetical protein
VNETEETEETETNSSPPMTLSPYTLAALDLSPELAIPGNVAANAWRLAYASPADPFAGINLGFRDAVSTDFLVSVVVGVEEAITADEPAIWEDATSIDVHEIADYAVPVYNAERMRAYLELDPYGSDPIDGEGIGVTGDESISEVIGRVLYGYAYAIASALCEGIEEAFEDASIEGDEDETA